MLASSPSLVCLECRERVSHLRGLCERCYARLGDHVRSGKITWRELEEAGRARPRGRSPWHQGYAR